MKFTLVVDDISGNSFIENPHAPEKDPLMKVEYYTRLPEQDAKLGLQPDDEKAQGEENEERGARDFSEQLFMMLPPG